MDDPTSRPAENGRYALSITEVGVYVKVYPPKNGGQPLHQSVILEELKKRNITLFLLPAIETAVQEAKGRPVLIANPLPPEPPPAVPAEIRVHIRPDRLRAFVDVILPPDASPVSAAQILQELQAARVVYGIDHAAIADLVDQGFGTGVCCARGKAPQDGTDAVLTYHIDIEAQGRPEEIDGDRVDFKNINKFLSVNADQLLLEKMPASAGIPGNDIFGNLIPAKHGKEIALPVGKNVNVKDKLKLLAAIDGQLHIAHGRVGVLPLLEIKSDIDYDTGNIDFIGSVLVHGSLQCGFSIKAGGNVEIRGSVSGGVIEATNILVHKGIQGMNRSQLKAREDISALFVENASLFAGKNVTVSDVVMNSSLFAGLKVAVIGRRGRIIGGRISAGEEICSKTVGNHTHLLTRLEVAGNPFLKDELDALRLSVTTFDSLYQESKRLLGYLNVRGRENLDAEKQARHEKLSTQCVVLEEQLLETKERIADIEALLKSLKPGIIRVADVIYPGTQVSIGRLTRTMTDALQHLSLYVHDGEIRISADY